jgi:hypothetical protein
MFAIEDGPEYVGYTTGEGWKVYESPYFEKEVIEQIFIDTEDVVWGYNELQDYYTYHLLDHSIEDVNNLPVVHGTFIETIEGTKHVYQLGAGSWIWSERSDFEKYIMSASKTHSWADEYAIGHAYSWEDAQRWITNRMKEKSCFMVTVWQKNKEEGAQVIKKYYKEDTDRKEYYTFEIHTRTEEKIFQNFLKEHNIVHTTTLNINSGTLFFEVKCTKAELDLCKHFLEQ